MVAPCCLGYLRGLYAGGGGGGTVFILIA